MSWFILMIMLTVLDALEVQGVRLADIYWNTTNSIFRIDNTDHIIDVNKNNLPFEYDQVNIICPLFPSGTSEEDAEQYLIYNVSKEEYDSCRITNSNPRIIAICNKPTKLMYFTITFRSFTPQPGGLEFRPGQDYYFISTSSGKKSGLRSLVGGKCRTNNMKIIFKVCCDKNTKDKERKSMDGRHPARVPDARLPTSMVRTTIYPTRQRLPGIHNGQFPPSREEQIPPFKEQFIPPFKPSRPRLTPIKYLPPSTHRPYGGYQPTKPWFPSVKVNDRHASGYDRTKKTRHRDKGVKDKSPNDSRAKNELLKNNHNGSMSTMLKSTTSSWLFSLTCLVAINQLFIIR